MIRLFLNKQVEHTRLQMLNGWHDEQGNDFWMWNNPDKVLKVTYNVRKKSYQIVIQLKLGVDMGLFVGGTNGDLYP